MKKSLAILVLLGLPAAAPAYQLRAGDSTNALVQPPGETLAEETLWAANRLDVQGRAARDLWLLAVADARFGGEADGDLRVFAGSARIDGTAQQNLLAYAGGLHLTSNSVVLGEAALAGSSLICEGAVAGDAWLFAKSATLGGRWGGDVHVFADEIRLAPGTKIAGNLVHTSAKPLVYDPSVAIGGTVSAARIGAPATPLRSRFLLHGYLFLAALLVGMPFVGFFPLLAGSAVRKLRTTPWRALVAGALALVLGPFLVAFAFMTAVGIPLAALLGALLAAAAYLGHVVVALGLGHALLRAPGPQTFARVLSALAAGLFFLYFAAALPGVAPFLVLPATVLGTGALVLAFLQRPTFPFPMPPPVPPPPLPKMPEPPETPE